MPRPGTAKGVDQRLVDLLMGAATTLVVAVGIASDFDGTGRAEPIAYLLAVGFGVLVLARRRAPGVVLALTVLAIFAFYSLGYAPIGALLPAVVALYSATEAGRTRWAGTAGGVLVAAAAYVIHDARLPGVGGLLALASHAAMLVAAITLGMSVQARREARENQEELYRATVAEQARQADLRLQEERMRIARDLHDVIGHTLSVVAVHGNVAAEAIGRDDDAARRAVGQISDATSATMRELRATVKVLRSEGTEVERGAVGMAAVPQLVQAAREAGVVVDVDLTVPDRRLDGAVDAAGYRIVQEALTNVLRHSGATRATVRGEVRDGRLELAVTDNGRGPAADLRLGAGLTGMQERATVLGGRVGFETSTDGGFAVRAVLPARLES